MYDVLTVNDAVELDEEIYFTCIEKNNDLFNSFICIKVSDRLRKYKHLYIYRSDIETLVTRSRI